MLPRNPKDIATGTKTIKPGYHITTNKLQQLKENINNPNKPSFQLL